MQIQREELLDLTTILSGDINFKLSLNRANEATIRMALEQLSGKEQTNQTKTAISVLRRQLKKLTADVISAVVDTNTTHNKALALNMGELQAEREAVQRQSAEQAEREARIAEAHEVAGRVQAFNFVGKVLTVGSLVQLKNIKESKAYADLPNIGTWESYCKYLGLSRQKVDEDLGNLADFGEQFLLTVGTFSLGYRELRKLRKLTHDGSVQIEDNIITIGDESIPIDKEHTEDLHAAIEKILENNTALTQRVTKLEKHKDALVKEETKGLVMEKKALLEQVERLKVYDPKEQDHTWALKQMQDIEKQCGVFVIACSKLTTDERFADDRHIQALTLGKLAEAKLALRDLEQRLDDIVGMFND